MRSLHSPESPKENCFCGCLASPCRDNKYCSELCARVDTEKMLLGEPSHYRSVSQTEVIQRLVRSDSRCRVAARIMVKTNMACDSESERLDEEKPLPPLPPLPQLPTPGTFVDVKTTLDLSKHGDTLPPRPLKRLHSSILARRTERRVA